MSHGSDFPVGSGGEDGDVDDGNGIGAVGRGLDFRGPAEAPEEDDHANDHFALVYEDREEQFDAAIPFVRQGLARGERCVYVADDNSRAEIRDAMRDRGIDVDEAIDSGALSIRTPAETYHRTGEFDREAMTEFWEDSLEAAKTAEYTGLRAAAEMTWALDDDGTTFEDLAEYEALLNPLYDDEDYVVLCQYSRERFPAAVIRDVVETHPLLLFDDAVSRNAYYAPPEKFFESTDLERTVDRTLRTLRERTETKAQLREHKQYLRELHEATADNDRPFDETVERLLELGRDRFDLRGGALTSLPSWDGRFHAEVTAGPELPDRPDVMPVQPAEGKFCRRAIRRDEPTAVRDVSATGWADDDVARELGIEAYFGVRVTSGTEPYGTLWFYDTAPREDPFSEDERTFLEMMGRWVSNELERTERDRAQRRLYEITADADRSFEDKLQAMFDLGCERFDMELGGIAEVDPETDRFEVEYTSDDSEYLAPGERYPLSQTYCRLVADEENTACVTDPVADGYAEKICYERFGVRTYLGTYLDVDGDADRTFWFVSGEPREEEFSQAELTFHHLMGQWVEYELERRRRESDLEATVERLQQSNERLKQFAYAASHDLQEPLRMVSSYLQLLETEYRSDLDDDAREYIDFAVDGADRMRAMVDDLLAFSRVEQSDGAFEPVDCEAVLERVTDDLAMQIDECDATVEVGSLPTVTGDAEQLEQLFCNLVSNALKYGGEGETTVEITAERRGSRWEIAVADDGIGIDPEKTDRIFEIFKRLHHDDEYPGTGIGLSLCQEIVENHGGEIRVDSEPGEGSTFAVTLPRRPGE